MGAKFMKVLIVSYSMYGNVYKMVTLDDFRQVEAIAC